MATLKELCRQWLVTHAEHVLASQDEEGVFWADFGFPTTLPTVYHQYAHYPLAVLFLEHAPDNPYGGDPRLLRAVERSLDATCRAVHPDGTFACTSRGFDWGAHPDEWRAYFWMRTLELVEHLLPEEVRARCAAGLNLALGAVHRQVAAMAANPGFAADGEVSNHFCWYVLATYQAGRHLGRPEWCNLAAGTFRRIAEAQQPDGYWLEGGGFTTLYNYVSLAAMGLYHELSGDPMAREAVDRALELHKHFTYPDGSLVEDADGRVRYSGRPLPILPPTWSRTPQGAAYLRQLVEALLRLPFGEGHQGYAFFTDFYRHLDEGIPEEPRCLADRFSLSGGGAAVRRACPWVIAASVLTRRPMPESRWQLDRQNHLALWHRDAGHVAGGGGSKEQPEFSTFTVERDGGVQYLATSGELAPAEEGELLRLDYDGVACRALVRPVDERTLAIEASYEGGEGARVTFRLPLSAKPGTALVAGGRQIVLGEEPVEVPADGARCGAWALEAPAGATLVWPVLPFNSYRQDNRATLESAMIVLRCPVGERGTQVRIRVAQPAGCA